MFKWPENRKEACCLSANDNTFKCRIDEESAIYKIKSNANNWTIEGHYSANNQYPQFNLVAVLTPEQEAEYLKLVEKVKSPPKPEFKDGVYSYGGGIYAAIKYKMGRYNYEYGDGSTDTRDKLFDGMEYICEIPPENYKFAVLKNGDKRDSNSYACIRMRYHNNWIIYKDGVKHAAGIENDYLYAFPIEQPINMFEFIPKARKQELTVKDCLSTNYVGVDIK